MPRQIEPAYPQHARTGGFTLVELMITVIVLGVLISLAVPSFRDFQQRSITRGAVADVVAAIAQARLEAAKRNDFVTVSVRGSGAAWCVGVQQGTTGCDCLSATCNIETVPTGALRGARLLAAANFNGDNDFTIDPRLGMLSDPADAGSITVRAPSDQWDFRIRVGVTPTAQTTLCSPTGGRTVSDYPSC